MSRPENNDPSVPLRFWECIVDCLERYGSLKAKPRVVKRRFILEAENSDLAWAAASKAAEVAHARAFSGAKLIAVDVRSVATAALPYEVKSWQ